MFNLSGLLGMFNNLTSVRKKLVTGVLLAVILGLSMSLMVKSCHSAKRDNERLETINSLNKQLATKTAEAENLQTRILGLLSEIEHQRAIILSRNAEIKAINERRTAETEARKAESETKERVYDAIRNDAESSEWFERKVPTDLLEAVNNVNAAKRPNDLSCVQNSRATN